MVPRQDEATKNPISFSSSGTQWRGILASCVLLFFVTTVVSFRDSFDRWNNYNVSFAGVVMVRISSDVRSVNTLASFDKSL